MYMFRYTHWRSLIVLTLVASGLLISCFVFLFLISHFYFIFTNVYGALRMRRKRLEFLTGGASNL